MNFKLYRSFKRIKMYLKHNFLNSAYTDTLTPMHLRKAKLMFFYVRYPSSAIIKVYFPDVQFNKNNTAQLVKWFSNFRYVDFVFIWVRAQLNLQDHVCAQSRFRSTCTSAQLSLRLVLLIHASSGVTYFAHDPLRSYLNECRNGPKRNLEFGIWL